MAGTALVLSGGGVKGAYQAGFYDELRRAAVPISIISGVSVGALNGAYITCGKGDQLVMLWKLMSRDRIYRKRFLGVLGAYVLGRDALYDTTPLRELINQEIDFEWLRISGTTFRVSCCDALTGETLLFNNKSITTDILMGTCAVPGMFPPVLHEDALLIDGGVKNNMPIGAAIDAGADTVICVNTVPFTSKKVNLEHSMTAILMRAAQIEIADNMAGDVKLAELSNYCPLKKNISILQVAPSLCYDEPLFEFDLDQQKITSLIEEGRRDACQFLNRYPFLD